MEEENRKASFPHRVSVNAYVAHDTCYPGQDLTISISAKCLEGCSIAGKAVVVLDAQGHAVGRSSLGAAKAPGELHTASVTIAAPAQTGLCTYDVVAEPDKRHLAAQRLVHITVLPVPDRTASIYVVDETTDEALPQATVFFFDRTIGRGRPLAVETDKQGMARAQLCSSSMYEVRIECAYHDEARIDLEAGSDAFEGSVSLRSEAYRKEVITQRGYDPY